MLCGSNIKIWNQLVHMKNKAKKHKNSKFIDEKLKTKIMMFFISFFSCDLYDFKFWYVNRKAFGTSFLYWVDFILNFVYSVKQISRAYLLLMKINLLNSACNQPSSGLEDYYLLSFFEEVST